MKTILLYLSLASCLILGRVDGTRLYGQETAAATVTNTPENQEVTAASDVRLRWKFRPGQQLAFELSEEFNRLVNQSGQRVEQKRKSHFWMTWTIDSISDDDVAEISIRLDRVKLEANITNQTPFSWDSAEGGSGKPEDSGDLDASYRPLIGKNFLAKMEATGKITDVRIAKDLEENEDGAVAGSAFEALQVVIRGVSPNFPDNVSSGDEWSEVLETASQPEWIVPTSTFKYAGTQQPDGRPVHRIENRTEFSIRSEGSNSALLEIIDQKNFGVILFDNVAGRIANSTTGMDMTLVSKNGQFSMSLVQNSKSQITEITGGSRDSEDK